MPTHSSPPRVAFVQDGARLHYAFPIALQHAGILDRVFTEWYAAPGSPARMLALLSKLRNPGLSRRMLDRYHPTLDATKVISNTLLEFKLNRARRRFPSDAEYFQWHAAERGRWIERVGLGNANILMGFISNIDPGLLANARSRGIRTIADQIIAPAAVLAREDQLQRQRFPEWDRGSPMTEHDRLIAHEHATWTSLDHITCASDYVKTGLIEQGESEDRISVIPYPIDADAFPFVDRSNRTGPVKIGFVGRVNLRKGAPYFLEVARRFDPAQARFIMVGPVDIPPAVREKFSPHVELRGSVPRSDIPAMLSEFDIYYFPSTAEGSAGSISEAMCTGLPIVTSPNAGSVVTSGEEGFVAPYDDLDAATRSLQQLITDVELRLKMGRCARRYYERFNRSAHADLLAKVLQQVHDRPAPSTGKPIRSS